LNKTGCLRGPQPKTEMPYNTKTNRSSLLDELFPFTVGDYSLPTTSSKSGNYPPHDILSDGDDQFYVQLAVAGFPKDALEVTVEKRTLTIRGTGTASYDHDDPEESDVNYIHQGIAKRSFDRQFALGEGIEIDLEHEPRLENGILTVTLKHVIPDVDRPRTFAIK